MEGGIITPIHPPEAIKAADLAESYPFFFSSGIRGVPTAAVVAALEPEIAAKKADANTATNHSPPLKNPKIESANWTSFSDIFPCDKRSPAKIKKGTATKGNESHPANILCGKTINEISWVKSTVKEVNPIAIETGIPIKRQIKNIKNKNAIKS